MDSKDTKKAQVEKVEKVEKVTLVTKVTNSTFSTKVTRPLIIKGLSLQEFGEFMMLSKLLGLKYSEFINVLLSTFYQHNSTLKSMLYEREFVSKVSLKPQPDFKVRNPRIDQIILETKDLIARNKLSENAKAFRIEKMLMPYLRDRNVPEEQKADIIAFIDSVNPRYAQEGEDA